MKIQRVTLREVHMPLLQPFETSFGNMQNRRILLVQAEVDGVSGWGECTAGEDPFYCPETVETAALILENYIWPILNGRDVAPADEIWPVLDRGRGHNMAKGALEDAVW